MGRRNDDKPSGMEWANFGLNAFIALAQLIADLFSGKKVRVEEDKRDTDERS